MANNTTYEGGLPSLEPPPSPVFQLGPAAEPATGALAITNNVVTDNQLLTALWLNIVLGAIAFIAFCLLQRSAFPRHYRYRLISDSVTVKPRPLPTRGWRSLWQWFINALCVCDSEILQSSGMDAIVMIKALAIGVQILGPMALLGCIILVPINYTQRGLILEPNIAKSQLMQLTIAALPQGSQVMWVHFMFLLVYNAYAMTVLWWHYKQYLIVRHHYLIKGDDPNYWIAMTQEAESSHISRKVNRMLKRLQGAAQVPMTQPPEPLLATRSTSSNRRSSTQPHGLFGRIKEYLHSVPFPHAAHDRMPPAADRLGNRSGSEPLPEHLRASAASPAPHQSTTTAQTSVTNQPPSTGWMMGPSAGRGLSSQPMANPLHMALEPSGSYNALVSPKLPPLKRRSLPDDGPLDTITEAPEHAAASRSSTATRAAVAAAAAAATAAAPTTNPMHMPTPSRAPSGLQPCGSLTLNPLLSPFATSADAHAAATSIAQAGVQADLGEVRITIPLELGRIGSDSALAARGSGATCNGSPMAAPGHRRNKSTGSGKNVAYHWWKELPSDAFERPMSVLTQEGASSEDADDLLAVAPAGEHRTLLAVPSVRFRKTINTSDQRGRPVAVNAQHYAVLVTDVEQGPYPEIQAELEAKRRKGLGDKISAMVDRATNYVASNSFVCCGYSTNLFTALGSDEGSSSSGEEEDEEACDTRSQWGVGTIKRLASIKKDPGALAEVELTDAAHGIEEARRTVQALQALASQPTEDSGMTASTLSAEDANKTLKRLGRVEARLSRLAAERERQNALSRDHSTLFSVAARNTSVLGSRPGSVMGLERRSMGHAASVGGAGGPSRTGSVNGSCASRAGSIVARRSSAVAGAIVGVPEALQDHFRRDSLGSPSPDLPGKPRPMRASSEVVHRPRRELVQPFDVGSARPNTLTSRPARKSESGAAFGGPSPRAARSSVLRTSFVGAAAGARSSFEGSSFALRGSRELAADGSGVSLTAPHVQQPPTRLAPLLLGRERPWQQQQQQQQHGDDSRALHSLASLRLAKSETSMDSTPPSSPRHGLTSPMRRLNSMGGDSASDGSVIIRTSPSHAMGPSHLGSAFSSPDPWDEMLGRPNTAAFARPCSEASLQSSGSPIPKGVLHGGSRLHTTTTASVHFAPAPAPRGTPEAGGGRSFVQRLASSEAANGSAGASSSGSGHGRSQPRGWALVKRAMRTGALKRLLESDAYSVVTATFKRLFPEDFDRAIPVFNHKEVDQLLTKWELTVAELERAQYQRDLTGKEPTKAEFPCDCCFGPRLETIPMIQERILSLEEQIEVARDRVRSTAFTPSWFVLFKSQKAASVAASARFYSEDNRKFHVHAAPGPEEVNWQHLWLSWRERNLRSILAWPVIVAVVFFPITLITSSVGRLDYLLCMDPQGQFYWNWYCVGRQSENNAAAFIRAALTGWLPSLLLNLWLVLVLPRVVYLIVQSEGGCHSLSKVEKRVGAIFFYWDIFNVFLQGVIGSTFFQQIQSIIMHPESLLAILGAALPDASNFFMQFISLRAMFLVWLRLCVPHGGVWQNWCHYIWCHPSCCATCNTERDQSLTYGPRTPRYGFEMGHVLLMYLIALAFSVVAPLVVPFAVVFFAFAWVAWRHNLSYVYTRKYESGGLMWPYLFSRICVCLVINQVFTFCVFIVKGAYLQAFLLVAFMPLMTLTFYRNCKARFEVGVNAIPLDLADRAPKATVPPLAYIPPPLQERSWGWYPEWNKIWDGWGMPRYGL